MFPTFRDFYTAIHGHGPQEWVDSYVWGAPTTLDPDQTTLDLVDKAVWEVARSGNDRTIGRSIYHVAQRTHSIESTTAHMQRLLDGVDSDHPDIAPVFDRLRLMDSQRPLSVDIAHSGRPTERETIASFGATVTLITAYGLLARAVGEAPVGPRSRSMWAATAVVDATWIIDTPELVEDYLPALTAVSANQPDTLGRPIARPLTFYTNDETVTVAGPPPTTTQMKSMLKEGKSVVVIVPTVARAHSLAKALREFAPHVVTSQFRGWDKANATITAAPGSVIIATSAVDSLATVRADVVISQAKGSRKEMVARSRLGTEFYAEGLGDSEDEPVLAPDYHTWEWTRVLSCENIPGVMRMLVPGYADQLPVYVAWRSDNSFQRIPHSVERVSVPLSVALKLTSRRPYTIARGSRMVPGDRLYPGAVICLDTRDGGYGPHGVDPDSRDEVSDLSLVAALAGGGNFSYTPQAMDAAAAATRPGWAAYVEAVMGMGPTETWTTAQRRDHARALGELFDTDIRYRPRAGYEVVSRSWRKQVSLDQHSADTAYWARTLGAGDDVVTAAWLHDVGKAHPAFQTMLGAGETLLAKSGGHVGTPSGIDHAYVGSQAAQLAGYSPLVCHLIASHHGSMRPTVPAIAESHAWTDRFYELSQTYGAWGLAWLEWAVRASDWRASAQPGSAKEVRPLPRAVLDRVGASAPVALPPTRLELEGACAYTGASFYTAVGVLATLSHHDPHARIVWDENVPVVYTHLTRQQASEALEAMPGQVGEIVDGFRDLGVELDGLYSATSAPSLGQLRARITRAYTWAHERGGLAAEIAREYMSAAPRMSEDKGQAKATLATTFPHGNKRVFHDLITTPVGAEAVFDASKVRYDTATLSREDMLLDRVSADETTPPNAIIRQHTALARLGRIIWGAPLAQQQVGYTAETFLTYIHTPVPVTLQGLRVIAGSCGSLQGVMVGRAARVSTASQPGIALAAQWDDS